MTDHPTDTDIIEDHWAQYSDERIGRLYCDPCDRWFDSVRQWANHVAEALTAARRVETVDELDALPAGTVVLDRLGGIVGRERNRWSVINAPFYPTPEDIVPATILYRPDSEDPS